MEAMDASVGWSIRPAALADEDFLLKLFRSVRASEFEQLGWPERKLEVFLDTQFRIQRSQYAAMYPQLACFVLECRSIPIGHLDLARSETAVRVVEISLLSEWRGLGIGGSVLRSVIQESVACRHTVRLSVAANNPAIRLYRRLGFREERTGFCLEMKLAN